MEGGVSDWIIEDGIAIPPKKTGRQAKRTGLTAALTSMKVRQSVLVKDMAIGDVTGRIGNIYRDTKKQFVTRSMPDGLRVWRLA